ncbi:MAG TPA: hypothetical protein VFS44_09280 [Gemmatimonadaceae bacterium]|nr:hypothetical protein [Gemmatimonadaceae bacterium]
MTERQKRSRTARWLAAGALAALVLGVLAACSSRRRDAGDSASAAPDSGAQAATATPDTSAASAAAAAAPVAPADSTAAAASDTGSDTARSSAPSRGIRVHKDRTAAERAGGTATDSTARDSLTPQDSQRLKREIERIRHEPRRPVTPPSSSLVKPDSQ